MKIGKGFFICIINSMSEFNTNPIDIVLPWLNPTKKWMTQYKKYCEDEDPARVRDLNTIRPTLRGILNNAPWVRYIWLVLFDEEQIKNLDWPELKNNKIKFIYHKDFLPKEFLPNFNSSILFIFLHNNQEIAENIICMDDDMIFIKPVQENMYFEHDIPVHHRTIKVGKTPYKFDCMWHYVLKSTEDAFYKITKTYCSCTTRHMPFPITKTMLKFIDFKIHNDLYQSCINAKIRRKKSISMIELAYWIEEFRSKYVSKPIYDKIKSKFLVLSDLTTEKDIKDCLNYDIVCINDSERLIKNVDKIKQYIIKYFN